MTILDARPLLFIISGPSGAGKGTALRWIVQSQLATRVPTYTTRPPREAEVDGVDYHFVDDALFEKLSEDGTIFEYTRTYSASSYGSPSVLLDSSDSRPLLTELDPNGFVRVRAISGRRTVGLFITASTEQDLRDRITARGQGAEVGERLKIRTDQLTWAWMYDYVLVNDDLDQFYRDLELVVRAELTRTAGAQRMLNMRRELDPTLQAKDSK